MATKIPFIGQTSTGKSSFVDYQKTVNWYPEASPSSKGGITLYPTPGYEVFSVMGLGLCRGGIVFGDKLYVASGNQLFEVTTTGGSTLIGTIGAATTPVRFAHNGVEIILVDGTDGYLYNPGTTTYTASISAVDADFPTGATHVEFFDGYFVVNDPSSAGRFMFSDSYNGLSWNALSFATAERSPDALQAIAVNGRELWLIGSETAEPWFNSGAPIVPFEPIQSGFSEWGCVAPYSVATNNGTIFWLSNNKQGQGQVVAAAGLQPKVISTSAIADVISEFSTISDAIGWTYDYQRHSFYVLTFPTANRTFVYDLSMDMWHEWSHGGVDKRHISNFHVFFNNRHVVGSYLAGQLLTLNWSKYTDNGESITRLRRSPYIHNGEDDYLIHNKVKIEFEPGVGNSDCEDPQAMLRWTNDGHTFSNELWRPIGKQGEYHNVSVWRKLGRSKYRAYEIQVTDPVKAIVTNAFVDVNNVTRGD